LQRIKGALLASRSNHPWRRFVKMASLGVAKG
jgi:hypothetical protein